MSNNRETSKTARRLTDDDLIRNLSSKNSETWSIKGLPANAPDSELGRKLRLFGQFVGAWDIVEQRFPRTDKGGEKRTGEAHFNWVLAGRAVQDVWGPIDSATGRLIPAGTTLRFYDTKLDAWRSTWISPLQLEVRRFIGRKVGEEIVLQEEPRGLRTERWVFSDIRADSFRWYAVRRSRLGGAWHVVEEMKLVRRDS